MEKTDQNTHLKNGDLTHPNCLARLENVQNKAIFCLITRSILPYTGDCSGKGDHHS